ncbi:MAG: hypothetical protein Q8927_17190 [Bacteroidota bacterium]|nr:hypothetical protein [Bacteroidota bacterium]MDP4247849.1 hypothetical protein [Bacteroidota bacterium]MDP4260498.1 hypothetical protein [Bacteroidota bacterium]
MKKLLIAGVSLLLTQFTFAQNRHEPPAPVRESFQKEYPHSQPNQWIRSSAGWSVSFEDRDNDNGFVTAHFDSRGRHMDTHVRYDNHDVPDHVVKTVQDRYPGAEGYRYVHIERPYAPDLYEIRFRHRGRYRTTYLDENGRVAHYNGWR